MKILIQEIARPDLVELSGKLASAAKAPADIVNQLSSNDDISIAAPLLKTSDALADEAIAEIAELKALVT